MKAWKMGFDGCANISFGIIKRRPFQNFYKILWGVSLIPLWEQIVLKHHIYVISFWSLLSSTSAKDLPVQSGLGQEDRGGDLHAVGPFSVPCLGFFYSILKILTPEARDNTYCHHVTKGGCLHSVRETVPGI